MQKKFPLTPRIQIIVDHILPDLEFWDLCCDHGYIGIGALAYTNITAVHFVDQVTHIIDKIKSYNKTTETPIYYHSIAAEKITDQFQGTVVVCGVGINTIMDILNAYQNQLSQNVDRWIIGPHHHLDFSEKLNEALQNYQLTKKTSITERGRVRDFYIYDKL